MKKRLLCVLLCLLLLLPAVSSIAAPFVSAANNEPSVVIYVNGNWISAVSLAGKSGTCWLEFPINADALRDTGEGNGATNYVRIAGKASNGSASASQLRLLFSTCEVSNTYVSHNWWVDSDWALVEGQNADILIEGWNGSAWVRIHSDNISYTGNASFQLGKQDSGVYQGFVRNLWVSNGTLSRYTNFRVRAHVNIGTSIADDNGDITQLFLDEFYRDCAFCPICGGCTSDNCTLSHTLCGCVDENHLKFASVSLCLNKNIDVIYSVWMPEGYTNPRMTVNETTLTDYTVKADGSLRFVYTGISPDQMTDELDAVFYASRAGEEQSCSLSDYSVRTYCEHMLNGTQCASDASLRTLLSDLLVYGSMSQVYTGYRTDALAAAGLDLAPSEFVPLAPDTAHFSGNADAAVDWIDASLILKHNLAVRFGFRATSTDGLSVVFTCGNSEQTVTDFISDGNGTIYAELDGVNAAQFDTPITAAFYRSGTQIGRTVQYSVNTYVSAKQDAADADLKNLVRALYCYGEAARNYEKTHPFIETPVDMTRNCVQPAGTRENALSLNGEWQLRPDFLATRTVIMLGDRNNIIKNSLSNRTLGMTLTLPSLGANDFVSARAFLLIESSAQTTDGGSLSVSVRANDGQWVTTDISDRANGWNHWVDLALRTSDLQTGSNTIEIRSNASSGLWLYGTLQSGAVGYQVTNGSHTSSGMNYLLGFCKYSCSAAWNPCTVPAAAEADLKLPYTGSVFPDTYNGVVWYKKTFSYSADAAQQWLCFNAVDYQADVWLNGQYLGSHEGGYTGFEFCVTDALLQGENTLIVRVVDQNSTETSGDDAFPIKETLAGFSQDTRGMNYCGIWQSVWLEPRGYAAVSEIYVDTGNSPTVNVTLCNPGSAAVQTTLTVSVPALGITIDRTVTAPPGKSEYAFSIDLSSAEPWNPSHPSLYEITVTAACPSATDTLTDTFGVSQMAVSGNQFIHNGQPVLLTGILHWGSYYENYTSAVSEERTRYEISQLKAAGFNAVKYCLTCPPDYVLDIYDEMGMYVYIEYPIWSVYATESFFERAYLQIPEMLKAGRTHPCVVMSDFDCEDAEFFTDMERLMQWCVNKGRELDPKRVYTDNSGDGAHSFGDFTTCHPYYQANAFGIALSAAAGEQPLVLGEFDDVSVLRDLQTLNAQAPSGYTWYHSYFGDTDHGTILREAGWTEAAISGIIESSHSNAQELMKYFIETAKAQNGVGAMFFTQMTESPQGWADGFLDDTYCPNYDSNYLRMAASDVALLCPMDSVNYYQGNAYTFTPKLSLYGGFDISGATLTYEIRSGDTVVRQGTVAEQIFAQNGGLRTLGTFSVTFPQTDGAERLTLHLELTQAGRIVTANEWTIWSYPPNRLASVGGSFTIQYYDPTGALNCNWSAAGITPFQASSNPDLVITSEMTQQITAYLNGGGKVLYAGAANAQSCTLQPTDFDRYGFAYAPYSGNFISDALKTGGWGGLQFLDLATPYYLAEQTGSETMLGRVNITEGTLGAYIASKTVSGGILLQTTFRLGTQPLDIGTGYDRLVVSGENPIGRFLLEQMALYLLTCT